MQRGTVQPFHAQAGSLRYRWTPHAGWPDRWLESYGPAATLHACPPHRGQHGSGHAHQTNLHLQACQPLSPPMHTRPGGTRLPPFAWGHMLQLRPHHPPPPWHWAGVAPVQTRLQHQACQLPAAPLPPCRGGTTAPPAWGHRCAQKLRRLPPRWHWAGTDHHTCRLVVAAMPSRLGGMAEGVCSRLLGPTLRPAPCAPRRPAGAAAAGHGARSPLSSMVRARPITLWCISWLSSHRLHGSNTPACPVDPHPSARVDSQPPQPPKLSPDSAHTCTSPYGSPSRSTIGPTA